MGYEHSGMSLYAHICILLAELPPYLNRSLKTVCLSIIKGNKGVIFSPFRLRSLTEQYFLAHFMPDSDETLRRTLLLYRRVP
jgi:hypothetical protein